MNTKPLTPIHAQVLDPTASGMVQYSDFLPVIAKRLQNKETVDDLMKAFRYTPQSLNPDS
jgi:hypothetical protein